MYARIPRKRSPSDQRQGTLCLLVSQDGRGGSLNIHRDVDLYMALLPPNQGIEFTVRNGRQAWMHVVRCALAVNGRQLAAGDGLGVMTPDTLAITADTQSEFLLFNSNRPFQGVIPLPDLRD